MLERKYELITDQLFRIGALISFGNVEMGEIGGFIECENNLSQYGDSQVYGDARALS